LAHTAAYFPTSEWVACPECDLVQRDPRRLRWRTVVCLRCGATLHRSGPHALEATLAMAVSAAVLFAFANAFPFMSLELQGRTVTETLFAMTRALHLADMSSVAILVFLTLILMPALQIAALLYLLAPLQLRRVPAATGSVARLLNRVRPWSMVEVFMLAALVSIGKLQDFAELRLEPGFWCLGAVMLLFAVTDTIFDQRALWQSVQETAVSRS
jgi:paraquat-inducible protein A